MSSSFAAWSSVILLALLTIFFAWLVVIDYRDRKSTAKASEPKPESDITETPT